MPEEQQPESTDSPTTVEPTAIPERRPEQEYIEQKGFDPDRWERKSEE
jgi:hypothetical protein